MAYVAVARSRLKSLIVDRAKMNRIYTELKDHPSVDRKKFNKFCDEYAKWIYNHGGTQTDAETALAWLLNYTVIEEEK